MMEHSTRPRLFLPLMLASAALFGSCADSGGGPPPLTTVPIEDLPRCRSLQLVYSFFGQNPGRYRHLDVSGSGVVSKAGEVLWRPEAPEETARLDEILATYAAGMDRATVFGHESWFPGGELVVHARADTPYAAIEFLLSRCLQPSIGITCFQFPVRGTEDAVVGFLELVGYLGFEAGEIHDWDLRVNVSDRDGVAYYSIDGGEPRDLDGAVETVDAYLAKEREAWIRPDGEARWGDVTALVGEFQGTGVIARESYQRAVDWLGSFLVYHRRR